ncbi:putative pilus system protein FilC [Acinetobacter lwoffii]|uniref:putative pilus system protein FilC n=1 Tax=Acinetobacter lwoffii TaxID=28090 RepID=UPI00209B0C04|nr:transporter [Acinetobacter lwoffii]MCO8080197.1 transporter [Acinetobacter lwoffii]
MDMNSKWMNKTFLALSIQMVMGVAFAAEEPALGEYETVDEEVVVETAASVPAQTGQVETQTAEESELGGYEAVEEAAVETAAPVETQAGQVVDASQALQQQEGDATQAANLEEVFTSNERQYSLIKQGEISSYYDIDYTYYRDTQLDIEMAQGQLYQLRVQENATHSMTNTFTFQYGVKDNLTLTASLPLVAKTDLLKDTSTAGLGDISLGARWEPFPLKAGRLPLILFANLSTKTGDSPYEINAATDLAAGKGYYSAGVGASTRKYIDPVVLFASVSANYGFKESGLNQRRGSRIIEEFEPGVSGGFAFGFAYSFNYDVSMTMSYQQSFNTGAEFSYNTGESYSAADQTSSTFAISLGVRVSPETIVNGTVGLGLTEDAPDVSLGLSFPLDILGFGKKIS